MNAAAHPITTCRACGAPVERYHRIGMCNRCYRRRWRTVDHEIAVERPAPVPAPVQQEAPAMQFVRMRCPRCGGSVAVEQTDSEPEVSCLNCGWRATVSEVLGQRAPVLAGAR